jgi:hypothetical protein
MISTVRRHDEPAPAEPAASTRRAAGVRVWAVLSSGWLPAGLVFVLAVVLLLRFHTPAWDVVKYLGYLGYGLALPGTLLWRAIRGAPRSFVEDVALGTALGYAVEIPVYLGAAALGVPWLVAVWPAVVIGLFAGVPSLRRHGRRTDAPRARTGEAWLTAALVAVVLGWLAATFFVRTALTGPASRLPYVDLLFQLALAGEAKHHVPPRIPFVDGEPLHYHWFAHAHLAASSTVTGTELAVLLFRLSILPMAVVGLLGLGALAARLSGRSWAAPVAVALAGLVGTLSPYAWQSAAFGEMKLVTDRLWQSPTQTYGTLLAVPAVLLVTERLRGRPGPALAQWAAVALVMGVLAGAKATFLPILFAGAALAVAVGVLVRRTLDRAALAALSLAGVTLAFATFVLFGGASQGLLLEPLRTLRLLPATVATLLFRDGAGTLVEPLWAQLAIAALAVLAWCAKGAGVAGLFAAQERWQDPAAAFLAGMVVASVGVALLFTHPGGSQFYFLVSALPYLAVLSAWGLTALVAPERTSWRVQLALIVAALAAAFVCYLVMRAGGAVPPRPATSGGRDGTVFALVTPYAGLAAVLAVVGVLAWLLRRRLAPLAGVTAALVVALALGFSVTATVLEGDRLVRSETSTGFGYRPRPLPGHARPIAADGVAAARWLRDHSDPDDVVATNTHCHASYRGFCDNRHFWISGYSERRVLLESWGYTARALAEIDDGEPFYYVPYWRPELLAENDRAFRHPSAATVGALRTKHGVRWLFVDERYDTPPPELDRYATVRYRGIDVTVYEL